jgi:hypothetical protein
MILTSTGICWGFLLPECPAANLNARLQCRYFAKFRLSESTGSKLAEGPISGMLHGCGRLQSRMPGAMHGPFIGQARTEIESICHVGMTFPQNSRRYCK